VVEDVGLEVTATITGANYTTEVLKAELKITQRKKANASLLEALSLMAGISHDVSLSDLSMVAYTNNSGTDVGWE
jgi:hypothetical protein